MLRSVVFGMQSRAIEASEGMGRGREAGMQHHAGWTKRNGRSRLGLGFGAVHWELHEV